MRTELILHVYSHYIQIELSKLFEEFSQSWDTRRFEAGVRRLMDELEACVMAVALNAMLSSSSFLEQLKAVGSALGMRYKEYRTLQVRLQNGLEVTVKTPYFIKAEAKRGRKKKGPNGQGRHLGLQVMGIVGQATPGCISMVAQLGLLCPSTNRNLFSDPGRLWLASRFVNIIACPALHFSLFAVRFNIHVNLLEVRLYESYAATVNRSPCL